MYGSAMSSASLSEKIGRETVQYVSNIYKYYVAYTLVLEREQAAEEAKARLN